MKLGFGSSRLIVSSEVRLRQTRFSVENSTKFSRLWLSCAMARMPDLQSE